MKIVDSHCHIDDEKFDQDREKVISNFEDDGIDFIVDPASDISSSEKIIEIVKKYDRVYGAVGIHPHEVEDVTDEDLKKVYEMSFSEKIVAIGEIGLDYYYDNSPREKQKEIFRKQLEIAEKRNLPVIIHTRDAIMDTLEILKENPVKNKGVFHCCPQNRELIKEGLKLGFYISFAGPITFKSSKNADEMINLVPNDRILIETDSPYLAPEPVRGTRNTPINVKYVAQKIADAKGMTLEQIADITYENARKIFKI